MLVGFSHALYEGGIGHIGVNLLDDQSFGALCLIFVGAFRVDLLLPQLFTFQVLIVASAYVSHDTVDGFRDTILTGSRSSHQTVHQRSLMLHIVNVAEACLVQMSRQ